LEGFITSFGQLAPGYAPVPPLLDEAHTTFSPYIRYTDLPELVSREGPAFSASSAASHGSSSSSSSLPAAAGSSGSLAAGSGHGKAGSLRSSSTTGSPESIVAASSHRSIQEVCKVVYASPTKVHLSLDSSRGPSQNPALCYPDIAFAVEDFDHAFSSVVGVGGVLLVGLHVAGHHSLVTSPKQLKVKLGLPAI